MEFESASKSAYPEPPGSVVLTKCINADVRRSGRKHLTTNNFLKGLLSRSLQSSGSFSVSGVGWLNHSKKRGADSSKSAGNFSKPNVSCSANAPTMAQAVLWSQGAGASPGSSFCGPRNRNASASGE